MKLFFYLLIGICSLQVYGITPPPLYTYTAPEVPLELGVRYFEYRMRPDSVENFTMAVKSDSKLAQSSSRKNVPTERGYQAIELYTIIPLRNEFTDLYLSYWHSCKVNPYVDRPYFPGRYAHPLHYDLLPLSSIEDFTLTSMVNSHLFQLQMIETALQATIFLDNDVFSMTPRFGLRFCHLYQAVTNQLGFFYLQGPPIEEFRNFNSNQRILGLGPEAGCKITLRPLDSWILLDGFTFFGETTLSQICGHLVLRNKFTIDSGAADTPLLLQSTSRTSLFPVMDFSSGVNYDRELFLFSKRILGVSLAAAYFSEIWINGERHFDGTFDTRGPRSITLSGYYFSAALNF